MIFNYTATSARDAGFSVRTETFTKHLDDAGIAKVTTDAGVVLGFMASLKATPTGKMTSDATIRGKLNKFNAFLSKLVSERHRKDEKRLRLISVAANAPLGHVDVKFATIDDVKKTMTVWNVELSTPGNTSFPDQYSKITRNRGVAKGILIDKIFAL